MKKVLAVLTALALMLTGCTGRPKAEDRLKEFLTGLQNTESKAFDETFGSGASDGDISMMKAILKSLEFEIVSCTEDGDTASAEVVITNKNMENVMSNYFSEAINWAVQYMFLSEEEQPSDEEINAKYTEILMKYIDEETETVTNTVTVNMTYDADEKTWNLEENDEFLNAIFGGLYSATNVLTDSLEEIEGE